MRCGKCDRESRYGYASIKKYHMVLCALCIVEEKEEKWMYDLPVFVWILIISIGLMLFAMMFGFMITTIILIMIFLYIGIRTWVEVYNDRN